MTTEKIVKKLIKLSDTILKDVLANLPKNNEGKFILFLEIVRNLDYWSIHQKRLLKHQSLPYPDYEIMLQGWNLVLKHLCVGLETKGIPIIERTSDLQLSANTIIHGFGRSVLLKRTSQMLLAKLAEATVINSKIEITLKENATSQYLDILEFTAWNLLQKNIKKNKTQKPYGWHILSTDFDKISGIDIDNPGAFCILNNFKSIDKYQLSDKEVIAKMEVLLFPWDSGYGVGTGYEADRDLDLHYVYKSLKICDHMRDSFGFHPSVNLLGIKGEHIALIIVIVVALHLKHIDFVLLACNKYPQISPHFSLTIWTPKSQLIDEIKCLSGLKTELIETALNAILLSTKEYGMFENTSEPVIPLLVDLNNGFILRPISTLVKNPFFVTMSIQNLRTPNLENILSKPREKWMREHLYAMFKGNRYTVLEGNAILKTEGKVITDIDAAILDITSGELALFQIKWQDYFTNDIKKLSSKSKNLVDGIDSWSEKVENWIANNGIHKLLQVLRLKVPKSKPITKVILFGLSKTFARTSGFGHETKNTNTALCNWPAFMQARTKIGPADLVFTEIFNFIQSNHSNLVGTIPLTHNIKVREIEVQFNNLWFAY